jgi:hypothetical protein
MTWFKIPVQSEIWIQYRTLGFMSMNSVPWRSYQIMLKPAKFVVSGLRGLFADNTFSLHVHSYKRPERNSEHVQSCDDSRSQQLSLGEAACVESTFNKLITSPSPLQTHTLEQVNNYRPLLSFCK